MAAVQLKVQLGEGEYDLGVIRRLDGREAQSVVRVPSGAGLQMRL